MTFIEEVGILFQSYFSPLSGRGVLIAEQTIAVNKQFKSFLLLCDSDCKQILIKLRCQYRSFIIGQLYHYISPSSDNDIYYYHLSIVDDLKSKNENYDLFIVNNYNLPKVEWLNYGNFTEFSNAYCFYHSSINTVNVDTILTGFSFMDKK